MSADEDLLTEVRREARQIVRDGLRAVAPQAVAQVEQEERMKRAMDRLLAAIRKWWTS